VAQSIPFSSFTAVVFPAPFGPRKPNIPPSLMEKDARSGARLPPLYALVRRSAMPAFIFADYTKLWKKVNAPRFRGGGAGQSNLVFRNIRFAKSQRSVIPCQARNYLNLHTSFEYSGTLALARDFRVRLDGAPRLRHNLPHEPNKGIFGQLLFQSPLR